MFLYFFGAPNVKKYVMDESFEVQLVESKSSSKKLIPAPSIVICPTNPSTSMGWKINKEKLDIDTFWARDETFYRFVCGTAEDLPRCIWDQTYSLEETVVRLSTAGGQYQEFGSSGYFRSDITFTGFGQCHILQRNATILPSGRSLEEGFLTLTLNNSLDYDICFVDERLFYLSSNPSIVPGFRIKSLSKTDDSNMFIRIVKHIKRNTDSSPCNGTPDYSFTDCLREAVETKVGCSLPWNMEKRFGNCTKMVEYEVYENLYDSMNDENPKNIGLKFGCKIPCNYREYILEEESQQKSSKIDEHEKKIWIALSTPEIVVKQEKQIYEATSLVGDIGGSLGLFLGFSLLMLWDWLLNAAMLLKSKFYRWNKIECDLRIINK